MDVNNAQKRAQEIAHGLQKAYNLYYIPIVYIGSDDLSKVH